MLDLVHRGIQCRLVNEIFMINHLSSSLSRKTSGIPVGMLYCMISLTHA